MAELKRPSTRERSHSAKARLTPPYATPEPNQNEMILKEAKERAKSAKAIKSKHKSSSGMFVQPSKHAGNKSRFTSMYSQDFDGTFVPPAEIRPTSPTRRNNPHPAKQFMVWKLPSREIGATPYVEGLELPPEYITRDADFDAIDELSGNFGGLQIPPVQPTSSEYGAYLRAQRNAGPRPPRQREGPPGGTRLKPLSNDMLGRVVSQDNEQALGSWLKYASPEEQHTILKMLKSAEEAQVKKTISKVMQPEAARAVEGWLKNADDKEKEVAVRLFSSLGSRPNRPSSRQRSLSDPRYPDNVDRPPSRKPVPPTPRASVTDPSAVRGLSQRSRRQSAPAGPRPKPWPAGIWHHQPVRDPPPQVYHRGALFGAMKGDTSHFDIHPEWPDYYGAGDVVH